MDHNCDYVPYRWETNVLPEFTTPTALLDDDISAMETKVKSVSGTPHELHSFSEAAH